MRDDPDLAVRSSTEDPQSLIGPHDPPVWTCLPGASSRALLLCDHASAVVPARLAQLGLPHDAFEWSRDVFDPGVPHDAFWTFNEGFGIADSTQAVVFDEVGKRVVELRDSSDTEARDRLLDGGKARLQVLLDRYLGFNQ